MILLQKTAENTDTYIYRHLVDLEHIGTRLRILKIYNLLSLLFKVSTHNIQQYNTLKEWRENAICPLNLNKIYLKNYKIEHLQIYL